MKPTNTDDPSYFHKVVDCQWACPAHTNVPEYIRLIAQGRFTDAYMLNRESNVFPAILGRTCDRPCEPACRRTRVDGEAVAICRLKRVAADLCGDVTDRLPTAAAPNGNQINDKTEAQLEESFAGAENVAKAAPQYAKQIIAGAKSSFVDGAAWAYVAGIIAILVYDWIGVGFLRRRWINFDWLWTGALGVTGIILLAR